MSQSRLTRRGPNASTGARLPGLEALRISDPQAQKAFEALREWVEVRLGSRGDKYEKAVTLREFEQHLAPIVEKFNELENFTGNINTLTTVELDSLPDVASLGAFAYLSDGKLYFGDGKQWHELLFAPP